VNSCAPLPCPPGPCHQTGKSGSFLLFRIPQALAAESASHYPPAPEPSAGASIAAGQLVTPALGSIAKWDKGSVG